MDYERFLDVSTVVAWVVCGLIIFIGIILPNIVVGIRKMRRGTLRTLTGRNQFVSDVKLRTVDELFSFAYHCNRPIVVMPRRNMVELADTDVLVLHQK